VLLRRLASEYIGRSSSFLLCGAALVVSENHFNAFVISVGGLYQVVVVVFRGCCKVPLHLGTLPKLLLVQRIGRLDWQYGFHNSAGHAAGVLLVFRENYRYISLFLSIVRLALFNNGQSFAIITNSIVSSETTKL
jgi:hypothetical protein